MPLCLIAAAAGSALTIGKDGDLPWHFSADLKFFKEKTMGHPVVMGRVTYASIVKRLGKPLPGRQNFVVTRDASFTDPRATVLRDVADVAKLAAQDSTLFVIGGASLYRQTIDKADTIYLTHIDTDIEGDAHFPPIDPAAWQKTDETVLVENGVTLRFCTYQRRHS